MAPNPLSLKQRLAALSLSPSSPTSPHGLETPLQSPGVGKRRTLFNPPWGKRHADIQLDEEQECRERVQEVIGKLIFQAGVDFETRPMVVLNASALPDPREVSYDLLLSRILSYLDLYVESDYTVIFFAAGGKHTPGWSWVWKAYRSLSRKYRKNLKRLYIVHSSFFSKMLFSLAGAIISPKFFRKLVYVTTLSELALHIPLTQIDIHPAVYQENLKHEKKINLPVPTRSNIFGVPLEELMGYNGEKGGIPRVVRDCIQYLRETGMEEDGLFRRSPSSVMLKQAQEAYDRGHTVSLETFADSYLAAVLLKKYLRDLPEPIFPESLYPTIRRCPVPTSDPNDMSSVIYIRETLLPELVPCCHILLTQILHLMHDVSLRSALNRMDAHNLAVILCPNLVSSPNPTRDVMMCGVPGGPSIFESNIPTRSNPAALSEGKSTLGMIIKLCIQRYYEIFDEVWDRSDAVPLQRSFQTEPAVSSQTSSTSGSPQQQERGLHSDDDEDIDDAMLVMPIGPSRSHQNTTSRNSNGVGPPSAWAAGPASSPYKPRHRSTLSGGSSSGVRSMHTIVGENHGNGTGYPYASVSKARSMVSIEKGAGTVGRKGSISIGRGTTRKSSGAGVEAISITAEGFFSPPSSAPPVPPLQRKANSGV